VRAILRWGNISDGELADHENNIRRWGVSSVGLNLTERQLAALIERGRGWPWNGYELRLMKEAGKYPPTRLKEADVSLLRFSFGGRLLLLLCGRSTGWWTCGPVGFYRCWGESSAGRDNPDVVWLSYLINVILSCGVDRHE
jgi:hypothetical protein